MITRRTAAVILAAGKSTRMKSNIPKVLSCVSGKPIIGWVIDSVKDAGISHIITVIGSNKEKIKKEFNTSKIQWVEQKEQLGTGHAVKIVKTALSSSYDTIVVLQGDIPLIKPETIKKLLNKHKKQKADVTILTTNIKNPSDYGRIIRGKNKKIERIVEETDAKPDEKKINEVNTGIYIFNKKPLFDALNLIKLNNNKKEFYLTDVIAILHNMGKRIEGLCITETSQVLGVNTQRELAEVTKIAQTEILDNLMDEGVTIVDPSNTLIETGAKIGPGTIIYPNTFIGRHIIVGKGCRIGSFISLKEHIRLADGCKMGYIPGHN